MSAAPQLPGAQPSIHLNLEALTFLREVVRGSGSLCADTSPSRRVGSRQTVGTGGSATGAGADAPNTLNCHPLAGAGRSIGGGLFPRPRRLMMVGGSYRRAAISKARRWASFRRMTHSGGQTCAYRPLIWLHF